ncbi:hypothetical protein MAHJHV63_55210 [Mycobacterium avium subsp. hominissuis]
MVQPETQRPGQFQRRAGCEALLAWGAGRGATRAYLAVPDDDAPASSSAAASSSGTAR